MHLHFEKSSNTKCDCTILSLSWMGKVREKVFPRRKFETFQGWSTCGYHFTSIERFWRSQPRQNSVITNRMAPIIPLPMWKVFKVSLLIHYIFEMCLGLSTLSTTSSDYWEVKSIIPNFLPFSISFHEKIFFFLINYISVTAVWM